MKICVTFNISEFDRKAVSWVDSNLRGDPTKTRAAKRALLAFYIEAAVEGSMGEYRKAYEEALEDADPEMT